MPLDLGQIPTDDLLDALHARYPDIIVAGCNAKFIDEHVADLFYIQGNILTALGLWALMQQTLTDGFKANIAPDKHDAP